MKAGRHSILNFTIKYDKNSIFLTSADISVCQQLSDFKLKNTVHVFIILQWYHHLFYLQLFLIFFAFLHSIIFYLTFYYFIKNVKCLEIIVLSTILLIVKQINYITIIIITITWYFVNESNKW